MLINAEQLMLNKSISVASQYSCHFNTALWQFPYQSSTLFSKFWPIRTMLYFSSAVKCKFDSVFFFFLHALLMSSDDDFTSFQSN